MKYRIQVRYRHIPEDWTNFKRIIRIATEHAPSNTVNVLVNKAIDHKAFTYIVEADGHDIRVTLDNRDDNPPSELLFTSGHCTQTINGDVSATLIQPKKTKGSR